MSAVASGGAGRAPRRSAWTKVLAATAAGSALALTGTALFQSAQAAGTQDARIAHVEPDGDTVKVLVDVPAQVSVDLAKVRVTVDGTDADATAEKAEGSTAVTRTSILAIDTSRSMKGKRFASAQEAARMYLDAVPADVRVGIVTFASTVEEALEPSTDREAARAVIDGLTLTTQTRLYEGVQAAVELAGTEGQRSVLVLSDGADTTGTDLSEVITDVKAAEVKLDVVALDQTTDDRLAQLANAGEGRVIEAKTSNLASAFAAEADVLSRQVLVTAAMPDSVTSAQANLEVTLPSDGGDVRAAAFTQVRSSAAYTSVGTASEGALPGWVQWAGIGAVGFALVLGLGLLLTALAPRKVNPEDRVTAYTDRTATKPTHANTDQLATAKRAAANFLERNGSLDERIRRRLDQAGSELRSPEWLVVHTACVIAAILLGALVGGGSFLVMLLFLVGGLVLPWLYLGFRRGKRVKAFNAALPDTLQLMSGSLAAGLSLGQSVDTIVKEGSEPMAGEFKRVLIETRLGVSIEEALEGITDRFDSKDFAWVIMAIRIQRQVGGNLAELLDTVAGTIREREYLRRQVASLSAEGKMSAWVLGGLPPLFLVYLSLTQWDYVEPMFTTGMGWVMLAGAGLMLGVGAFWMSRMVKVDV